MGEKKCLKINLKTVIIIVSIMGIAVIFAVNNMFSKKHINLREYPVSDTITMEICDNEEYAIINRDYMGEYDLQYCSIDLSKHNTVEDFDKKDLMSYKDYKQYCKKWRLRQQYFDSSKNYIVYSRLFSSIGVTARLGAVEYIDNNVNLYVWYGGGWGCVAPSEGFLIVVPTDKHIEHINIINTQEHPVPNTESSSNYSSSPPAVYKPIIYLYPLDKLKVSVSLPKSEYITCSYPKYDNCWNVIANPNSSLKDITTGKNLYALYYESKNVKEFNIERDGFIVSGEDVATFLEEKLKILGLTERESEEFIIYWLPKLQENKYNYIRFATIDEINKNMPIEISPIPDTIIRILMTYKGLDNPIQVEEQKLVTPKRVGFVAVEWGGTEIK